MGINKVEVTGLVASDICNLPYFPMVSSGNGADWEGLALDIIEELDRAAVWKGNTGKCVNTKEVGDGEKNGGSDPVIVLFTDKVVLVLLLIFDVLAVMRDSVDVGVGVGLAAAASLYDVVVVALMLVVVVALDELLSICCCCACILL